MENIMPILKGKMWFYKNRTIFKNLIYIYIYSIIIRIRFRVVRQEVLRIVRNTHLYQWQKEKKIITYIYSFIPSEQEARASYLKEYNENKGPLSKLYVYYSVQESFRNAKQINFGQALYSKKIRHSIAKKLRGL